MRFSAAFNLPLQLPLSRTALSIERLRTEAQAVPAPVRAPLLQDLPEDLDARVRLIGEWQLGDS